MQKVNSAKSLMHSKREVKAFNILLIFMIFKIPYASYIECTRFKVLVKYQILKNLLCQRNCVGCNLSYNELVKL